MDQKLLVFIGFLMLSAILMVIAAVIPAGLIFIIPKLLLILLGVLFDVLAFASRYYSYLIIPLFKQRSKNVVISDQSPYWLSSGGECIVRKISDDYMATAYINIPLYVSASEMDEEEKLRFANQVGRLVGLSKEPVRFTTELYLMNKDVYIQKLKDNIVQMENEEATLLSNKSPLGPLEHVRGKLAMWKKMLDNVSVETSFELGSFAALSATGVKEFEAVSLVQQKARELMNGIGATLGVAPFMVTGNDLLKYVEPEYLIPYSTITEQISQNIQHQV
jgi:hypothetical protein